MEKSRSHTAHTHPLLPPPLPPLPVQHRSPKPKLDLFSETTAFGFVISSHPRTCMLTPPLSINHLLRRRYGVGQRLRRCCRESSICFPKPPHSGLRLQLRHGGEQYAKPKHLRNHRIRVYGLLLPETESVELLRSRALPDRKNRFQYTSGLNYSASSSHFISLPPHQISQKSLRPELMVVLKHQQLIEELIKANEKLRQILVEDLKIPPSKLQATSCSSSRSQCAD